MRPYLFTVTLLLLLFPMAQILPNIEESQYDTMSEFTESTPKFSARSSNFSVVPSSGWTTGGEEITITGSGFFDQLSFDRWICIG